MKKYFYVSFIDGSVRSYVVGNTYYYFDNFRPVPVSVIDIFWLCFLLCWQNQIDNVLTIDLRYI